jgi:Sugar phosphate isomerases/epimerases
MKLSCLSVSLFPAIINGEMTIKEYATLCKELGLDGFDLGVIQLKNHTPVYINQLKKEFNEVGITPAMITTYPDFTHPDTIQREREFEYLRHDIALASNVGAQFLRITAGQAHPEMPVDKGIELVVDNFRKIAPVAEKFGVKLVYEDHSKPGAWNYMDFSNPPEIFLSIAEQIKDTSIGINFDTANILVSGNENTVEVLEKVIDKVETIHVAETATLGKMDPVLLGTGLAPVKEVFASLKKHGWDKWLCIEEWGNMGIDGVRKAVEYTRKMWEEA